jgi:hypothetical protein
VQEAPFSSIWPWSWHALNRLFWPLNSFATTNIYEPSTPQIRWPAPPPLLRATCALGSAVVYDSRIIHRGLGNTGGPPPVAKCSASTASRPVILFCRLVWSNRRFSLFSSFLMKVLILRFDRDETPPPGVRLFGTALIRSLASALIHSKTIVDSAKFAATLFCYK